MLKLLMLQMSLSEHLLVLSTQNIVRHERPDALLPCPHNQLPFLHFSTATSARYNALLLHETSERDPGHDEHPSAFQSPVRHQPACRSGYLSSSQSGNGCREPVLQRHVLSGGHARVQHDGDTAAGSAVLHSEDGHWICLYVGNQHQWSKRLCPFAHCNNVPDFSHCWSLLYIPSAATRSKYVFDKSSLSIYMIKFVELVAYWTWFTILPLSVFM